MRSNIRYVHPQTATQLRRYEQRIKQLETLNANLQAANSKLGQHISELNECHSQKAQILQESQADLQRKFDAVDQHYSKLLTETQRFSDEQAAEIAKLKEEVERLGLALKEEQEKPSKQHSQLRKQLEKSKEEQQSFMIKYYQGSFELEVWALRWASYEQECARVSELSNQYESQISGLKEQLRELTELRTSSVDRQNSVSEDQSGRVLADIINRHVDGPSNVNCKL